MIGSIRVWKLFLKFGLEKLEKIAGKFGKVRDTWMTRVEGDGGIEARNTGEHYEASVRSVGNNYLAEGLTSLQQWPWVNEGKSGPLHASPRTMETTPASVASLHILAFSPIKKSSSAPKSLPSQFRTSTQLDQTVPRFGKSSSTYRYRKWKSFPVIKANRNFLLVDLFRKRNSKNALSRTIFIIVNCALCHILYIFLHISHILHTIALPWTRLLFALTETFYFVSFLHAFKYRINVRKS